MSEGNVKTLLEKGKLKMNGLKSERTGKTYDAVISFKDYVSKTDGKTKVGFAMEFDNSKKHHR